MKKIAQILSVCFLVAFAACSSSSSGGSASGLNGATEVRGTVYAPNGTDPISGAVVYIDDTASSISKVTKNKGVVTRTITATCDEGEVTCEDPSGTVCGSTCTCADGTYVLGTTDCDTSATTITFCKGAQCGTADLDCDDPDNCVANISGASSGANAISIAVVTGAYDQIENVLAKLGYGDVDEAGSLVVGTETFDIYTCGGLTDYEISLLDNADDYQTCNTLFDSADVMDDYDIIFINCGADQSLDAAVSGSLIKAHSHAVSRDFTETQVDNIQAYVNNGGRLYVTDRSYDFIEQSFPNFMKFKDDPDDAATPGNYNEAWDGDDGIVSNATINDPGLISWITSSAITTNTIDFDDAPGNSCDTTVNGNSGSDNLLSEDTIRIGDFLAGWAAMDTVHDGEDTFVWIEGNVSVGSVESERPLTASKVEGDGCIIYSSYHTAETCPTTGFWPQERVLQYLVFEAAGSCVPAD
ncbi:hypothetical protein K1X76_09025 [bacterium]|nr:hypothetical protein [bacterium]